MVTEADNSTEIWDRSSQKVSPYISLRGQLEVRSDEPVIWRIRH